MSCGCRWQTWLGSCVAVASSYSSDQTPSLGTAMGLALKSKKKKKTPRLRVSGISKFHWGNCGLMQVLQFGPRFPIFSQGSALHIKASFIYFLILRLHPMAYESSQAGDQTQTSALTRATAIGFLTHCTMMGTPIFF